MSLKAILTAAFFFVFGVVAGIVALTTPIYQGTTYVYMPGMAYEGVLDLRVMPFARVCVSSGSGCISFSDAGLISSQTSTFVAYSVLVIMSIVIAVVGIVASGLEVCGRVKRLHLMILFIVNGVFAFVAWVMMVANRNNNPYQYNSGNWSSLDLGPSPGVMIAAWLGSGAGIAVAAFVKGHEANATQLNGFEGYTNLQGYNSLVVSGVPQPLPSINSRSVGDAVDTSPAPPGYVWTTTTTTVTTTVTQHLTPIPTPPTTTAASE